MTGLPGAKIVAPFSSSTYRVGFDLTLGELHGVQTPLVYVRTPIQPGSAITQKSKPHGEVLIFSKSTIAAILVRPLLESRQVF